MKIETVVAVGNVMDDEGSCEGDQLLAIINQSMSDKQLLIDKTDKHRSTIHISLLAWNTAMSFFHFGYILVYMGSLPIDTIIRAYSVDINKAVAQGLLNGCIPIGALIGAVSSAFIIQRFSRKNNIHLTNLVTFVVGFLIYIPNFYSFIFFRIVQGICVGVYCALIPMTIREFAPTTLSGRLGTFAQLNVCIGVVTSYFLTYVLKKATGDLTCQSFWYLVFAVPQTVILIQTLLLVFVFPYDTPKYLLLNGDEARAREVLKVIYKQEYVQQILEEKRREIGKQLTLLNSQIQTILEQPKQSPIKPSKLAFMMAVHVAITQQLTGVNAINVYCGPILEKATSTELAILVPTLLGSIKLSSTFVTSLIITKFGRKTLIQVGAFVQAVACLMMGIGFLFQSQEQRQFESLIIVGMFLFIAVFGLTLGPLTWIYISETVQPKYVPFATGLNWTAASSVIILFPILKENVLNGNPAIAFFFFMSCCLAALLISRMFLLETKDKTQRQIREEYINHKVC